MWLLHSYTGFFLQAMDLLSGLISVDEHECLSQCAQYTPQHLHKIYVFALMWSIGALLELDDRAKMEAFLVEKGELDLPKVQEGETIFEYLVDESGEWQHWRSRVQEYTYPPNEVPEYASILVPNVDNVRTTFLIDTIAKQNKAVLLIGEQGTAKTVMIMGYSSRYDPEKHLMKAFNFSSASTPLLFQVETVLSSHHRQSLFPSSLLQRTIESYVDKRVGSTYGPPAGKKMSVFVDDINMPVINEWGDQVIYFSTFVCLDVMS